MRVKTETIHTVVLSSQNIRSVIGPPKCIGCNILGGCAGCSLGDVTTENDRITALDNLIQRAFQLGIGMLSRK